MIGRDWATGAAAWRVHPWPADGPDAMQARVNKRARFYYVVDGDTYVIYRLREEHPKSSKRGR